MLQLTSVLYENWGKGVSSRGSHYIHVCVFEMIHNWQPLVMSRMDTNGECVDITTHPLNMCSPAPNPRPFGIFWISRHSALSWKCLQLDLKLGCTQVEGSHLRLSPGSSDGEPQYAWILHGRSDFPLKLSQIDCRSGRWTGKGVGIPTSPKVCFKNVTSFPVWVMAMYSALVLDSAKVDCFLADHAMTAPQKSLCTLKLTSLNSDLQPNQNLNRLRVHLGVDFHRI